MKEKRREIVNDSLRALHALADLMPQLHAHCSLGEMLETIGPLGQAWPGLAFILTGYSAWSVRGK